jgi:hypothetical protein
MCYEYSGWFDKMRAKQLRKAQQEVKPMSKEPAQPAPKENVTTKPEQTREKVPA